VGTREDPVGHIVLDKDPDPLAEKGKWDKILPIVNYRNTVLIRCGLHHITLVSCFISMWHTMWKVCRVVSQLSDCPTCSEFTSMSKMLHHLQSVVRQLDAKVQHRISTHLL